MELFLPRHDLWIFLLVAAVGACAGAYFARRAFMLGLAAFVVTLPILLFISDLGYFISESVGRPEVHLTDYGWDAYLLATAVSLSLPSFAVCLDRRCDCGAPQRAPTGRYAESEPMRRGRLS